MKKVISIMLALMMIEAFACTSSAEGASPAEGGDRFESDWAIPGGLVQIRQEEEGYRIAVDIEKEDGTGVGVAAGAGAAGLAAIFGTESSGAGFGPEWVRTERPIL